MKNKQKVFEEFIKNLSGDELKNYLLTYAQKDENFVENFTINLPKDVDGKPYKEYLKKIREYFTNPFRCYNKKGYYSEEMSIAGMLDKCHVEIEKFLDENKFTEAVRELLAIIETIGVLYENYDDLEGIITNECQKSINLLVDIFKNEDSCPTKIKVEARKKIELLVKNSNFEDFDLGDLNSVLLLLSIQLSSVEEGLELLNKKIEDSEGWKKTAYILSKIELLNETGKFSDLDKVIEENIALPEIRKYKIGLLLDKGNITNVIELLNDGLKLAENEQSRKTEIEWKDLLLDIYIERNDVSNIVKVAEDLFYNGFDPRRYFPVLKRYSSPKEWDETFNRLIASLNESVSYGGISNIKAWIFIHEKMWSSLWDLVSRSDIETILKYEKELKPHFANKMLSTLAIKLKEYVSKSTETKHYLFVAKVLTDIRLYPKGDKIADDLIFEFHLKYDNQKDFLDIIKKA